MKHSEDNNIYRSKEDRLTTEDMKGYDLESSGEETPSRYAMYEDEEISSDFEDDGKKKRRFAFFIIACVLSLALFGYIVYLLVTIFTNL